MSLKQQVKIYFEGDFIGDDFILFSLKLTTQKSSFSFFFDPSNSYEDPLEQALPLTNLLSEIGVYYEQFFSVINTEIANTTRMNSFLSEFDSIKVEPWANEQLYIRVTEKILLFTDTGQEFEINPEEYQLTLDQILQSLSSLFEEIKMSFISVE